MCVNIKESLFPGNQQEVSQNQTGKVFFPHVNSASETSCQRHVPFPPKNSNEVFCVLTTQLKKKKKSKTKFCIFIKLDKKQYFKLYSHQKYTVIKNAHTSLGISSTFSFLCLVCFASPFSAGLFPPLPAPAFPFFPLGTFFAGAFLVLGAGFGGAGQQITLQIFSVVLPSPWPNLLQHPLQHFSWVWWLQQWDVGAGHRNAVACRLQLVQGSLQPLHIAVAGDIFKGALALAEAACQMCNGRGLFWRLAPANLLV